MTTSVPPAWYSAPEDDEYHKLDFLYKAQATDICSAVFNGDLEQVERLCIGALGSSRLPNKYKTMYNTFLAEIHARRDKKLATEEETKSNADEMFTAVFINRKANKAEQEDAKEVQDLNDVVAQAKLLRCLTPDQRKKEQELVFQGLLRLGNDGPVKERERTRGARRSSH